MEYDKIFGKYWKLTIDMIEHSDIDIIELFIK